MTTSAYAPEPLPDEPLDGYLGRIAATTMTTTGQFLADQDIRGVTWIIRDFSADQFVRLGESLSLDPAQLTSMTLNRWSRLGLMPYRDDRGHQGGAWARAKLGRFCPDCLEERGGVHRLHWRIVWSFACVKHQKLLASYNPADAPFGEPRPTTPAVPIVPGHPALTTQRAIDDLLAQAAPRISSIGVQVAGLVHLADLGALTRVLVSNPDLRDMSHHVRQLEDLTGFSWADVAANIPASLVRTSSSTRLAAMVTSPALSSIATTSVHHALDQPSCSHAAEALWWMTTTQSLSLRSHAASRGISYQLWRTLRSQVVTDEDGFSYARAEFLKRFALTRYDEDGKLLSPIDPTKLPSSCWSNVLRRPIGSGRELEGAAASAALLMMASDRAAFDALDRIGLSHLRSRIAADWNEHFGPDAEGDANYSHLLELQRVLAKGLVPIDYARRRRIFPSPGPLGRNTLRRLLAELDIREGGLVPHCLSWYIHELLTGTDFLISVQGIDMFGNHRNVYRKWRRRWREEEPRVLYEIAERRLYVNNIDEPVTWQPEFVDGRWALPPDDGKRVLKEWATTTRAIRERSVMTADETDGYSLKEAVALAYGGEGRIATQMRSHIERFKVVADAPTLREAATRLGTSPATLSEHMDRMERYVAQILLNRSNRGISLTPAGKTLLQLIRQESVHHASPPRPVPAESEILTLPDVVTFAFYGTGVNAQRLRHRLLRFRAIAEAPTKKVAIANLGITRLALNRQMYRLERRLGQTLLTSSTNATTLTPAGLELLRLIQHETEVQAVVCLPTAEA